MAGGRGLRIGILPWRYKSFKVLFWVEGLHRVQGSGGIGGLGGLEFFRTPENTNHRRAHKPWNLNLVVWQRFQKPKRMTHNACCLCV